MTVFSKWYFNNMSTEKKTDELRQKYNVLMGKNYLSKKSQD